MKRVLKPVRFFTTLLAAVLLVGLLLSCASAGWDKPCGKDVYWELDGEGVLTVYGTGDMYSCVEKSPGWDNRSVKKLIIEPGVTGIGALAFEKSNRLKEVRIPDTVTRIGDYAFDGCSRLESVSIPDSVTEIGANPFVGCEALGEIIVSPDHPALEVRDGLLISKGDRRVVCRIPAYRGLVECVVPEGIEIIGDRAFTGTKGVVSFILPNSVKAIGKSAFRSCSSVVYADVPARVTSIGSYAFAGCQQLREVTLREGLVSIGTGAFDDCRSLKDIALPDSLTDLGERAFSACSSLKGIAVSPDHPYLGFEDGVLFTKTDRKLVFYAADNDAESYAVPEGIRIIGTKAFRNGNRLRKIILPGSVTKIEKDAFENCDQVGEIVFSQGLEEIEASGCAGLYGLKEIVLPEGLKTIGDGAFGGCEGLKSILIPESVTEIGKEIFGLADTVNLVVYAKEGSAAAEYCRANNLLTAEPGQEAPERSVELPSGFLEAYPGYAGLYAVEEAEDEAIYLARTPEGALVLLCGRLREDGSWSIVESATLPAESRVVMFEYCEMLDVGVAKCTVRRYHDDLWGISCIGWRGIYIGPEWIGGEGLTHLYGIHPWGDLRSIDWISLDEDWDRTLKKLDVSSAATPDKADREAPTPFYASPDPDSEKMADLLNGAPLTVLGREDGWTHVRLGTDDSGLYVMEGWVRTEDLAFGKEIREDRYADRAFLMWANKNDTVTMITPAGEERFPGTEYDSWEFRAVGEKTGDGRDEWLIYNCITEKLGWIPKELLNEPNG